MFARFFGGGPDKQPLGYNRGAQPIVDAPSLDTDETTRTGTAITEQSEALDERKDDQYHNRSAEIEENTVQSEPPLSARSDASRFSQSQRSDTSKVSKASTTRKTNKIESPQLSSLVISSIAEGDDEGFMFDNLPEPNGPRLTGLSMPEQRKAIDIWRLKSMPRKEFWAQRRKLYQNVPLGPVKKNDVVSSTPTKQNNNSLDEAKSTEEELTTKFNADIPQSNNKLLKEPRKTRKQRLREYSATHTPAETALLEMQLRVQDSIRREVAVMMVIDPASKKLVMPPPRPKGYPSML